MSTLQLGSTVVEWCCNAHTAWQPENDSTMMTVRKFGVTQVAVDKDHAGSHVDYAGVLLAKKLGSHSNVTPVPSDVRGGR